MSRYIIIILIFLFLSCGSTNNNNNTDKEKIEYHYDVNIDDIIFPVWVKDREGIVKKLNKAYVLVLLKYFDLEPKDVIGTKGEKLIPERELRMMLANDLVVLETKSLHIVPEEIPTLGEGFSYKYPYYNAKGDIIGTIGIWVPKN